MPPAGAETTPRTVLAPGAPAPADGPGALVELTGVTKRYGRLVALRDVSLSVAPGEFVFLVGPSEAGKTTLLKLVHGHVRANEGTVVVDGFELSRRWRRFLPRLRRRVAAVFQDHRLLHDMTARGNVAFALQVADLRQPRAAVRARADARLAEVGLGARATARPDQLSGGQQRRLAIARALGHDPVLLLADEPTANLDRRNAERVIELLERRCRAGTAVIVATHDLELTRTRSYRVVELRQGRIVADRPAQVQLASPTEVARLMAARRRPQGLRRRIGRVAQFVLGYTPPPPRPRRPRRPRPVPRRRLRLGDRIGRVARLVLGHQRPPPRERRAGPAGAWQPPRQVLDRLANGHVNGAAAGAGGASNGHLDSTAARPVTRAAGAPAPRPPERPAALATRPVTAPVPVASNGSAGGAVRHPLRRIRRGIGRVSQFVLGYTPPPPAPPRPRSAEIRGRPWTPLVNLGGLSVGGAAASWVRNLGTVAPALGSITLLLMLAGILSVSGFALHTLLTSQESGASVLHVYLGDDAAPDQVDQARQDLTGLPHVRSVGVLTKDEALAQARQRPGLADLASASDSNPFPASLEVTVDQPADVEAVARKASSEPGVDTRRPTSYDPGTYQRLRQFTTVAAAVAGAFGLLLLVITYVVSSNSIRAAVLVRRDELLTMQLVGASPWLIRARLAVEGALTGAAAGVVAGLAIIVICALAFYGARHLFLQVLPGVTAVTAAEVVAGVAIAGVCLGSVSALFAFRRLRP